MLLAALPQVDWHSPTPWIIAGTVGVCLVAASVSGIKKWKSDGSPLPKWWPFMNEPTQQPAMPPDIAGAASLSTSYEMCLSTLGTARNALTQADLNVLTTKQEYEAAVVVQQQAQADHDAAKLVAQQEFAKLQEASAPLFT